MQWINTLYSYTPINLATSYNGWLTGDPALNPLTSSGINGVLSADPHACGWFCQTGSGPAFGMSMWVRQDDFNPTQSRGLLLGVLKSFVRTVDSGAKIEGFFCGSCGVRIYTKAALLDSKHIVLKPGTLQDTDDLRPSADIWIQSKQEWFELPTNTKHFHGQPLPEELIGSYEEAKLS